MVAGAAILVAVAMVTSVWLLRPEPEAEAAATTQAASLSTLKVVVTATGTLRAARSEDLTFAVPGTVTAVLVDEGDKVSKGDPLARIDPTSLEAARTAARSAYDAALVQLDEDVDAAASDAQLAADEAAVAAANADWQDARDAVEDAVLRATTSGTIVALDLAVGDAVGSATGGTATAGGAAATGGPGAAGASSTSSSSTTTTDATHVSIATTTRLAVDAEVAAADISDIRKGLQVEIAVSDAEDPVYGTVDRVSALASTSSSGAAIFPVVVEVTGKRTDLYAGTSADVSIIVKQRSDVLTVPTQAVESTGGDTYVTVVIDGTNESRKVTIGEASGTLTEIKAGLEAGDEVVVPGFDGSAGRGGTGQQRPGGTGGMGRGGARGSSSGGGQVPGARQ